MPSELPITEAEILALFDAALDGIVIIDERGNIMHFNRAAESIFGYSSDEIVGQPVSALMTAEDAKHYELSIKSRLSAGLRNLAGSGREVRARRRGGTVFPTFLTVGEARLPDGIRYVGLMRDLSAEKQLAHDTSRRYDQMTTVSRLITAGEMAATLSHELNQPLTAIVNYTSASLRLLERSADNAAQIENALNNISEQAHRAGETLRRFRQLATRREHSKSPIDISGILNEIIPLIERDAEAHKISFSVDLPPELPKVDVDAQQIQQVLLHLIRNALESMRGTALNQRNVELSARQEEPGSVSVRVTDCGHGIPEQYRDSICDPFFTTKSAGTGMGLTICRSLLEAHGSKLQYTNNKGAGATFFFTLPAC